MRNLLGKNNPFFGKKHTKKSREKMSKALLGRIPWNKNKKGCYSKQALKNMSLAQRGRVVENIRENKHWNWQGGKSRRTKKHYEWRKAIFERDKYTCQKCGSKMSIITHHPLSYWKYPKLRYNLDNGITLCRGCHCREHPELVKNLRGK